MGRPKFNDWIKKNAGEYNYEVGRMEAFHEAADALLLALGAPEKVFDIAVFRRSLYDLVQDMRNQAQEASSLAKSEWPFGLCAVQIKIPYGVEACGNMLDENGYCDFCGGEEA